MKVGLIFIVVGGDICEIRADFHCRSAEMGLPIKAVFVFSTF